MRFAIRYICIFASLLICCSCDLEELKLNNPSESTIDFIARPTDYNNVDVATKSEPTDEFETEIHTAYLLLFDANNNRIYFSEVDPQSRLQRVTLKGLSTVTACFVANVAKADIEGITTLDALNSAVLNLNYATYSEAGGHLGVPKLAINDTYELCFPMVGVKTLDVSQISQAIEIPLTRLFAKVSVELKMNISNVSDATRFELYSYKLVNLPLKVRLLPQNAESAWVTDGRSFAGENSHVALNINHKIYNDSYRIASEDQKKYSFDLYVPEYQLESLPSNTAKYGEPEYKPIMYDQSKKAVHVVLSGSYIPREGSSSDLDYSVFLGEDESKNFTLNRNTHYNNYLTIQGITKKADNTEEALVDHRVKKREGDMVSMFGEVANCYIISKEGKYSFPAYKGAFKADQLSKEYLCNGNRAEIIYRSNTTDIVFEDEDGDGNLINVTTDIDGTKVIGFKLSKVNAEDNVIIAIYDSNDDIQWTWHLWFVTGLSVELLGDKYFQMSTQTMPNANGKEMMDRNLGVTTSGLGNVAVGTLTGLYYKYGHKGPFIGSQYWDYSDLPDNYTYTWTGKVDKKSRTDPCPPGYRIPDPDIWNIGPGKIGTSTELYFYNLSEPIITYPYTGYLDNNRKKVTSQLSNNTIIAQNFEKFRDLNVSNSGESPSGFKYPKTRTQTRTEKRYYKFKYNLPVEEIWGQYWTSDQSQSFHYSYNGVDLSNISELDIKSYFTQTRTVTTQQEKSGMFSSWKDVGTPTTSKWSDEQEESFSLGLEDIVLSVYLTTWAAELLINQRNELSPFYESKYAPMGESLSDYGLQVRCVKE